VNTAETTAMTRKNGQKKPKNKTKTPSPTRKLYSICSKSQRKSVQLLRENKEKNRAKKNYKDKETSRWIQNNRWDDLSAPLVHVTLLHSPLGEIKTLCLLT